MKNKFKVLSILLAVCMLMSVSTAAFAAGFSGPVAITSIGQSADGQVVQVLARRAGIDVTYDSTMSAASAANYKTIIMVIGGSSKGLGAAGINQQQEEARAQAMISAAKNAGTKIIAMHVGGAERRGELTDGFIKIVNPAADMTIVAADGNSDGIFSNATIAPDMSQVTEVLKSAFQ